MRQKLKRFLHYWVSGLVILVVGGFVLWVASFPLLIIHAFLEKESGELTVDSWLKGLIGLAELIVFPFVFGWLMHRIVTRPKGVMNAIVSVWASELKPEANEQGQGQDQIQP